MSAETIEKPAKTPREKKAPAPPVACSCSADCPAETRSKFAPGHDARLVATLVRESVGQPEFETHVQAIADSLADDYSQALADKFVESAHRYQAEAAKGRATAEEKAAAKEARAAEAAAAKQAKADARAEKAAAVKAAKEEKKAAAAAKKAAASTKGVSDLLP